MKKLLKRIGICVICVIILPFAVIILFIGFEIIGAIVNSLATANQTKAMQENLQDTLQNVTIIDAYSETGNTTGTGNHTDMLSIVIFQENADLDEVIEKMSVFYELDTATGCWIQKLDDIITEQQKYSKYYSFLEKTELPADREHCYVFVQIRSAPFADNIMGH